MGCRRRQPAAPASSSEAVISLRNSRRDSGSNLLASRGSLNAALNQAEAAIDAADYASAIAAIDDFRSRVQDRAGQFIANEWRATRDVENQAGQLIAGVNSLGFSVAYLRDFGQ